MPSLDTIIQVISAVATLVAAVASLLLAIIQGKSVRRREHERNRDQASNHQP